MREISAEPNIINLFLARPRIRERKRNIMFGSKKRISDKPTYEPHDLVV